MGLTPPEVIEVSNRARKIGISLLDFVGTIKKTYKHGGVTGFKFIPRNYEVFVQTVQKAAKREVLGLDHEAGDIGNFMGSDAKKNGYGISAREYSMGKSLHLELSRLKCDAHIDSNGITPGKYAATMLYAGRYAALQLFPHGMKDLAPCLIADSFAKPIAPFLNPILASFDIQARINGHDLILNGKLPETDLKLGGSFTSDKPDTEIIFTLTRHF